MGIDEHVCPVCGQPVATVVRRHRTLGAWVPVWSPGRCRNHDCEAYVDAAVEAAETAAEKPRAVARRTQGSHSTHGRHGAHGAHGAHGVDVAKAEPQAEVTTEATADVKTEKKTEERAEKKTEERAEKKTEERA